ncbi:MAG: response regulator [Planctomycetes bacterium]|nr:response regulator [Planctomycetota bacterium]
MYRGRVLIVDDDPFVRKTMQLYLETEGFEVVLAESGVEAVARLDEGPYDACVLDILMPRMNGIEVLRAIREKSIDVEVIVVTGCGSRDALAEVGRLGAYEYLEKPFADLESTVLRSVSRAVERKRLRGEIRRLRGTIERLQARRDVSAVDADPALAPIADLVRRLALLPSPGAVLREVCRTLCEPLGACVAAAGGEGDAEVAIESAADGSPPLDEVLEALRAVRAGEGPRATRSADGTVIAMGVGEEGAIAALVPAERAPILEDALLIVGAATEARLARLRAHADVSSI